MCPCFSECPFLFYVFYLPIDILFYIYCYTYLTNFIFCLPFSGWLELMTGVADKVVLPGELVVGDNDTGVHVS